jgi:hypothetical protein
MRPGQRELSTMLTMDFEQDSGEPLDPGDRIGIAMGI